MPNVRYYRQLPPVAVAFCTEKCVQRVGRDVCHSHPGSFISRVEHALTACFFERRLVHSASEPFLQGFGLKSEWVLWFLFLFTLSLAWSLWRASGSDKFRAGSWSVEWYECVLLFLEKLGTVSKSALGQATASLVWSRKAHVCSLELHNKGLTLHTPAPRHTPHCELGPRTLYSTSFV